MDHDSGYAHIHVGSFLDLPLRADLHTITDGSKLTKTSFEALYDKPIHVQDTPESLGLTVEKLSVRDISSILGPLTPIRVIDVRHQEELEGWKLGDMVEYFDQRAQERTENQPDMIQPSLEATPTRKTLPRSIKSDPTRQKQRTRVLNQISLELSQTSLNRRITPPQFVRDVCWIHQAWPKDRPTIEAQLYCLTSAAGSYTDFHIDFGGTSVWYHVITGEKVFLLIAPTEENLKAYETWLRSKDQGFTFLPSLLDSPSQYVKVVLRAGETMIIPSGWIHAVYTPKDSVVFGGNFLHGMDVGMQLRAHAIEERSKVPEHMRFPDFVQLHFFVGSFYLQQLREDMLSRRELEELPTLVGKLREWWSQLEQNQFPVDNESSIRSAATEAADLCNCSSVEVMLRELQNGHGRIQCQNASLPANAFQKNKIRLRISSPGLQEPEHHTTKTTNTLAKGLRIQLSSESTKAVAFPSSHKQSKKEDTDWIDEAAVHKNDEEWIPSATVKLSCKRLSGKNALDSRNTKQPKSVNVRDRLFKKFR